MFFLSYWYLLCLKMRIFILDLTLKEYKLNEKEVLKILTEVAVTRSEAAIVTEYFYEIF